MPFMANTMWDENFNIKYKNIFFNMEQMRSDSCLLHNQIYFGCSSASFVKIKLNKKYCVNRGSQKLEFFLFQTLSQAYLCHVISVYTKFCLDYISGLIH